ncbi:MAG: hypothetical protein ACFB0C_13145 [Leptolyngbyaceae cyanobacterium]
MDPITWSWLAATMLSGIVGNRVDAGFVQAYSAGWRRATRQLNAPELKATHDQLALTINRAFLWAQQSLVQDCLDEFTGGTYGGASAHTVLSSHEAEVTWLVGKDKQLKAALKQLERGTVQPLPEADLDALEGLLQSQDGQTRLRDQLIAVVAQEQPPAVYLERAAAEGTGLLARLAVFFEFGLKSNPEVQQWFQSQLLMQINGQLQTIAAAPVAWADLETALHGFGQQIPEVLNRIHNLSLALDDVGQGVDAVGALVTTKADQIVALITQNADDLATLKQLVGQLLIETQQQAEAAPPPAVVVAASREGPNPFIYGPAVPPEKFYGRRQAIADIKNRIGAAVPQSINIVGIRRNGKSSMLRYVKERINAFCLPEQKPLVVMLDLQDRRVHKPVGIVEGLRREVKKQTGTEPWDKAANDDPFELEDGLEALRDQGYRLIVLFDEFGAIGKRLEQFQDWGDDWRSKASASLVTLVVASRRPLSEVYQNLNLTSPFGNLFSTTILGALEPKSWQELLEQGQFLDAEIDWVKAMAGHLPF